MFKKIISILIIAFVMSSTGIVQAKPVSNSSAADLITMCLLEDDNKTASANGGKDSACCSKSLGYCVVCRQGQQCTKTSYRLLPPIGMEPVDTLVRPGNTTIAPIPKPPSLRDRLKQQQTTAPAKIMSPVKTPTVKPIKQYRLIKAPTKAVQTMNK